MAARDIFALIIRAIGAYSIFRGLEVGIYLLGAACGFDVHSRYGVTADSFFALSFIVIGLAVVAWAGRFASVV